MPYLKQTTYDNKHFQLDCGNVQLVAMPLKTLFRNVEHGAYRAGRAKSPGWNHYQKGREPVSIKLAKDSDFYINVFSLTDHNRVRGRYSYFLCDLLEEAAQVRYQFRKIRRTFTRGVGNYPVIRLVQEDGNGRTLVDAIDMDFHPNALVPHVLEKDGYDKDLNPLRQVLMRYTDLDKVERESLVAAVKENFGLVPPPKDQHASQHFFVGDPWKEERERRHREEVARMRDWLAGRRDDF